MLVLFVLLSVMLFYYFFFFQAEDGIRDKLVTGVQTCALPICEAPVERRPGAAGARAGPVVLGDEVIGALALVDVVAGRGGLLDALREDPRHEEREVADVPPHDHLALGLEVRRVLPDRLRLEEHVHDGFEARRREALRVEVLGACETGEEIGEIRRGRIVAQGRSEERRVGKECRSRWSPYH